MKLAEAAATYAETTLAIKPLATRQKLAAEVLKEHFRKAGSNPLYKGIAYAMSTFRALDGEAAKLLLGKKVDECMVDRTRETLSVLKGSASVRTAVGGAIDAPND